MSRVTTHPDSAEIVIHAARAEDMSEIARVAGRDTEEIPVAPLLVAKVGSDVRAAISLTDGTVVADPFHRTFELVEMLRIRAGAVAHARSGRRALRRRSRRTALTAGRAV